MVCQDRRIDAASMASELSLENAPIASCSPFRATPRWWYAKLSVSPFFVCHARCDADSASKALIAKSYDKAAEMSLYRYQYVEYMGTVQHPYEPIFEPHTVQLL